MSFNVNGVRACVKKTLIEDLSVFDADFVCLQETKATPEQVKEALYPLTQYYVEAYGAQKKGYSGTAILSKQKPLSVRFGIGIEKIEDPFLWSRGGTVLTDTISTPCLRYDCGNSFPRSCACRRASKFIIHTIDFLRT